jgi:hydroxyacylglutathione hydrolase
MSPFLRQRDSRNGSFRTGWMWSAAFVLLTSCVPRPFPVESIDTRVLRTGPSQSMIYLARTTEGLVVIDLGWVDAQDSLKAALRSFPNDTVAAVFLTHSHRDHIVGWPVVSRATFHVAAPERDFLIGEFAFRAWIPRMAEELDPQPLPSDGVTIHEFMNDTSFVFGADTVRAFVVAGHTAGSAAYLFRGILFAGDALTRTFRDGFRPPRKRYSEDVAQAAHSLETLFERVKPYDVRFVCTAHTKCSPYTPEFIKDALGKQ